MDTNNAQFIELNKNLAEIAQALKGIDATLGMIYSDGIKVDDVEGISETLDNISDGVTDITNAIDEQATQKD